MKDIFNTVKFLSVTVLPCLVFGWREEKAIIWSLGVIVGIMFMFWHRKKVFYPKITCMPEKNIHIFDDGKRFCHCLGTSIDGEKFYIPIKMQDSFKSNEGEGKDEKN
jgi:hypothetical protein